MDTEKTKVIFRVWPDKTVIALFPAVASDPDPSTCLSYEHTGQHSTADYQHVVQHTILATKAESCELAEELRRIGYNLISVYRQSWKDRESIQEQINRVRG